MSPENKKKLEKIRLKLDKLDNKLLALIKYRTSLVKEVLKLKEFKKLISEINSTKWKVLIPAFSMQRTQELLVELLENRKDNLDKLKLYYKSKKELSSINKDYNKLINKTSLSQDEQDKKIELYKIKANLESTLKDILENVVIWTFITDSPLSEKITEIYKNNLPEKYNLLDGELQKSIFWKEVIRALESKEFKKLYEDEKRRLAKDIIFSSWWMLQWWAITNHLKEIISDPNSKIIFTWYQAESTIWGKILAWEKKVLIEWIEYEVKCQITQVKWYSSHMWGSDLLSYLSEKVNYSKDAIIALTHWWESRNKLAEQIKWVKKKINIIVPKLFSTIKMSV